MSVGPTAPSLTPYLHELRQVTGFDVVFGGLAPVDEPVRLSSFIGATTDGLRNLSLGHGLGLGGKALATGRPMRVHDYYSAKGITRHYEAAVRAEGLRGMLCVPIRSAYGVHGVMYGGIREPGMPGDRLLDRAVLVAQRLMHDAAVTAEVERRLAQARLQAPPVSVGAQTVTDLHAELGLIRASADGTTRQMIDDLMHRLADGTGRSEQGTSPALALSPREVDVLIQVAAACSNADIAERLGLTESTVKAYLHSATRKLGVRSRMQAVAAARRAGLLP
ncbi:MAG: LuxR C-terminal-related transcriptional regulator [Sporichthyaceae bacterium]